MLQYPQQVAHSAHAANSRNVGIIDPGLIGVISFSIRPTLFTAKLKHESHATCRLSRSCFRNFLASNQSNKFQGGNYANTNIFRKENLEDIQTITKLNWLMRPVDTNIYGMFLLLFTITMKERELMQELEDISSELLVNLPKSIQTVSQLLLSVNQMLLSDFAD